MRLSDLNEMDSQGYSGSRDRKSTSKYGSRDDYELGHGKEGTGKPLTAKQMMDRAHKAMMKSMSNAEKVDKGWRNPNVDEGVAEGKEDLASLRAKAKEISDKIDAIVKDGGRVGLDDPLSRRLKAIRAKIQQAKKQGVAEGAGNIGRAIKSLYQKIYRAGDDEVEYFYNDSPIFAQYWDEYEGDLDSIIAEVDPKELQIMHDELESYVQQANLEEANYSPMTKDSMRADKIKSLKNLIAIAKEQGRGVRAQELELELKKLEGVAEGLADDLAAFAAKHGGKVRHGPQPNKPMTAPTTAPQVQLSTQEREALAARLKELEARFDPNYQYSDDYSFHSEQSRIASEIAGIKKKLGESIKGRSAIRQAMEAIDAEQRRVKQVPAEEMPKKTSPVLGQKEKQHPFKGRAVGGGL